MKKFALVIAVGLLGLVACNDETPSTSATNRPTTPRTAVNSSTLHSTSGTARNDQPKVVYAPGTTSTMGTTDSAGRDVDNTGINKRDRNDGAIVADSQDQNKASVDVVAEIRRRVVDADISITAQNVKIISESGKVYLRGPVKNVAEKEAIGRMAQQVAGAANVVNELEVEANP